MKTTTRPGGPPEISRGWSNAEPPGPATIWHKPRQGRQKDAPSRARRRLVEDCTAISSVRPNLQAVAFIESASDDLVCSTGRPSAKKRASSVSWLGEIPQHWQVGHLKRYARRIQTGVTPPTDTPEY